MTLTSAGVFGIQNLQQQDGQLTATLSLDKNHPIFLGHFPGQPVVPGACMLSLVKDVVENTLKISLQLKNAGNIKFMQMITPDNSEALQLIITYMPPQAGLLSLNASISNADIACFKLQAVFLVV
jgi:3-hydroxyacyl-[acyl-carrier-protein] dehydratase